MPIFFILILGFIFGLLLSYGGLNKYNAIAGLSMLKDFTVAKNIMLVLGVGTILLMGELINGAVIYYLKPTYFIGIGLGGFVFAGGTVFGCSNDNSFYYKAKTNKVASVKSPLTPTISGHGTCSAYPF